MHIQATLETEFIQHNLKSYESTNTALILTMIYDSIERSTERSDAPSNTVLNESLHRVKGFLEKAKKSTAVQFLCFREGSISPSQSAAETSSITTSNE